MKKNQLREKGLSMSQAQTVSNLCNQAVRDIMGNLSKINNASKTISYQGQVHTMIQKMSMPDDIVQLLQKVGKYSACQGLLMENIKAKDSMLLELRNKRFVPTEQAPEMPIMHPYTPKLLVDESWGWEQLSSSEVAEYIQQDALAAHIGQFIHKDGKLDQLRHELPNIPAMDWFRVNPTSGETVPVNVIIHHSTDQLWKIHEQLATIHREHEQRVNYYKAKVKNLVTLENARIANENGQKQAEINKANGILMDEYGKKLEEYRSKVQVEQQAWEEKRQKEIQTTAALRIEIPAEYQSVIDEFLTKEDKDH